MSDFKSTLNQYCQKFRISLPKYSTKQSKCSKGTPLFTCSLQIHSGEVFESQGIHGSKKSAEQHTAEQALKHLLRPPAKDKEAPSSTGFITREVEKLPDTKEKMKDIKISLHISDSQESQMSPDSSSSATPQTAPQQKPTSNNNSKATSLTPTLGTSKSLLNEHALRHHFTLPVYQSSIENGGFVCTLTFNNVKYKSKGYHRLKKEAEKSAALEAVLALQNHDSMKQSSSSVNQSDSPSTPQSNTKVSSSKTTPDGESPNVLSYKNLLQEYTQQRRRGENPKYETKSENGYFKSKVTFSGKTIESSQGFPNKKESEQAVAREALISLGIEDPEKLASQPKGKGRMMAKIIRLQPLFEQIHQIRKMPRLQENDERQTKKLKLESLSVEKEAGHINFVSVGEIWKEKGNVALVGNKDTSFVLYCTRAGNSLEILNTRTMMNQKLEPGYRLIGLDAEIVEAQGKLVLKAERCADIEVPAQPDPVLISCGVVTLHQSLKDSSHVEVLLKRYLVSQAFVNVKAAMAQFFRRALSGNPVSLPVNSLTKHIDTWRLDEVVAISIMTANSIKQVFSSMWKFKEQWGAVLEPPLPRDLQELQARAQQELSHRNAIGINITDFENHPWSLPKGNFRHRMLTTGLHIEKPMECAARELCEETGLQLYPDDLEGAPYIDLPQDDNLNPHKGDLSRYFVYVYKNIHDPRVEQSQVPGIDINMKPVSLSELLATEDPDSVKANNVEKMPKNEPTFFVLDSHDSSMESDQTPDKSEMSDIQMEPVSLSELLANQDPNSGKATKPKKTEGNEPTFFVLDDLYTSSSSSSSSSSPVTKTTPLNTELPSNVQGNPPGVNDTEKNPKKVLQCNKDQELKEFVEPASEGNPNTNSEMHEQRGKKRKRSQSDDEEHFDKSNNTPLGNMPSSSSYQSPSVKAGNHEECAWFPIEEAVKISPVFATIYENQTFVNLLESLKTLHH